MFFRSSSLKRFALAAPAAAVAFLTTGCSNMVSTAALNPAYTSSSVSGTVHGGNQPIAGATLKLYAAVAPTGNGGYGAAGTLLATTTTDGSGNFYFTQGTQGAVTARTYACPNSQVQIYIISSGGTTDGTYFNTTADVNSAAVMMAAVGQCGSAASVNLNINEVTTVATVWALQQYINPGTTAGTESVGAPVYLSDGVTVNTQAQQGLANAFATVANLASVSYGTANTSITSTGAGTNFSTGATAPTVTITPETAKINTIANIIAACVNTATGPTSGTGSTPNACNTLFASAVPPTASYTSEPNATFNTAVDTLQAAYYMATNPTNSNTTNLSNLLGLSSASAPFQPSLSVAPTDWTIGVTYDGKATTCLSGGLFIAYVYDLSVDGTGNVWMANGAGTTSALSEISNAGKPLACSGATGAVRGGAAIDTAGNVWTGGITATATVPSYVYKFDGTTTTAIPVPTGTALARSYAIAADGSGNVFYSDSANLKLYELPSTATASTVPTSIGALASSSPYHISVDSKGTVVVGQSGSGGSTITAFPLTASGGTTYGAAQSPTQATGYAGVYGVAFDSTGKFWVGNSAGASAGSATASGVAPGNTTSSTSITYNTTTTPVTATFGAPANVSPLFAGGLSTGRVVAVDGANNVWIANNTAASSGLYAVSEFSSTGAALSPTSTTSTVNSGGFTTYTQNGGFQKAATVFAGLRGLAIDPSGNVWVSNTAATTNTFVTEIVGAAVPVVTPLSIAAKNGTFGTKP